MPKKKKITGSFEVNFPAGGKKPLRIPKRPLTRRPLTGGPAVAKPKPRPRRRSS